MVTKLHKDANGLVGTGVRFERIRRITGYLVGDMSRWNSSKASECADRVKHMKV